MDWGRLMTFLPEGWQELASERGALKGLRKEKSVENLLRMLLLHVGCGHLLRETVVRARKAGLGDSSSTDTHAVSKTSSPTPSTSSTWMPCPPTCP